MDKTILSKYFKEIDLHKTGKNIGFVDEVHHMLLETNGPDVAIGEICKVILNEEKNIFILAEVFGFKNKRAVLIPYGDLQGVRKGLKVVSTGSELKVALSPHLCGRILDGFGNPIDNKEKIRDLEYLSIYKKSENPLNRIPIHKPISTGVKSIDGFLTIGEGQRMGIFSGAGVGKSTLLGMISQNSEADIHVIGLIGERSREVSDFIKNNLGEEGLKKTILVVSTADDPAILRVKSAYVVTTIAEYFQRKGHKVFLMIDSITRLVRAQREIGLAVGEMPTTRGYPSSIYSLLPKILERPGLFKVGSITAFYTVLVEGDDMTEPVSDNVMGILDGHIILSRKLANSGFYPSIDLIRSVSRISMNLLSKTAYRLILEFKEILSCYDEYEDLIRIGAYVPGSNPRIDFCIENKEKLDIFLRQDIHEKHHLTETFQELFSLFNKPFNIEEDIPSYKIDDRARAI